MKNIENLPQYLILTVKNANVQIMVNLIEQYLKWKKPHCYKCKRLIEKIFIWDMGNIFCSVGCIQKAVMGLPDAPIVQPTDADKVEAKNKSFLKTYSEL